MSQKYRIEKDSLGPVQVPEDALYGAQTQRAVDNFPISGLAMPAVFVRALALIKQAAARTNARLGLLDSALAQAIERAAADLAAGKHAEQFPVDVFQTGSGTSSNMNANEVIAHLASSADLQVHPNDHVNMGQSSNDVIPTAIQLSLALEWHYQLLPSLVHLAQAIGDKATEVGGIVKTGRSHLMDAMPLSMGQELGGWQAQIHAAIARLHSCQPKLHALPQGGTAVGTGVNSHPDFAVGFAGALSELCPDLPEFTVAGDFFQIMAGQDIAVEASGHLRTLATSCMKMANDLRWMNSGPLAGLGEIELQALQ
ncbi:MAG: lyase family protein, partial [Gammaproteobacteria bacterium]